MPIDCLIGGHQWATVGFVVWCELGFKDRQLLIERLLRCWPLLYSYTCDIHILYIK